MNTWKVAIVAALVAGCTHKPPIYFKIGAGYKFDEQEAMSTYSGEEMNNPISARIELGMESGGFSYGLSHHSQWLTGVPIDNEWEYSKTEVFIDYKFTLTRDK